MSEQEQATIRLDQFMKYVGMVGTGGAAKHLIQQGAVLVNGAVETRRSRKLHTGDRVTFAGRTEVVALDHE
ncbi:MAG TPA: RNA-binding S4 domain-containing protein [Chloroflexi bacterium]|nr:RNA-binding S4 domain-containing protein [Chloroflexota bacterium]